MPPAFCALAGLPDSANAATRKIGAKVLERLAIPADAAEVSKLADRYSSSALGTLRVRTEKGATIFDFGEWYSAVASRKNNDGTTSFITIDPAVDGFNFVDHMATMPFRSTPSETSLLLTL